MRRALVGLIMLLLVAAAPSWAEDELNWLSPTIGSNDAVMIVDNGSDWHTRLNLRTEPRKGSDIKGRIYTGTRVEIYEDNGEWCLVGLSLGGDNILTGYVMKQYLKPVGRAFSALCPLATVVTEAEITGSVGLEGERLKPGDRAYVLAVCGEQYYLMIPGAGQGYAPASAFSPLNEPEQGQRIVYRSFYVPAGGLTFIDERSWYTITLAGGVRLEDCWQIEGETQWNVTFGAGIQRPPRVEGIIEQDRLSEQAVYPFEGEVYAYERSFIACVGTEDGKSILRRSMQNGDILWAVGDVPKEAVPIDRDLCILRCEAKELLSEATMDNVFDYVRKHHPLDERTSGQSVTDEVIDRCRIGASLVLEPGTGEVMIHAWLEDEDGSYVTGGDLDARSGRITRWGCNA